MNLLNCSVVFSVNPQNRTAGSEHPRMGTCTSTHTGARGNSAILNTSPSSNYGAIYHELGHVDL